MLEVIRRAISFLRQKQILHKLGVVISITVIAIACYVLVHMLRGINTNEVIEAIKSTEPRQIALAAFFVTAGYFTLTFYDLFAVRAIGHSEVPYRVTALAAFTSYSIGHNVGASVFTGGAVRYRIYSAWGLNAIDVAKICFLAGLTFWLGNAAVLGLGIAYHPEAAAAIDQLPAWFNRAAAFAIIVVSATLLGFASHSPGGLGVFDAAMLVGLWQMDREDLLGGMLLFRVLYYIAPFIISVILLTFREVILGARLKRLRQLTPGPDAEPRREAIYVRERGDTGA